MSYDLRIDPRKDIDMFSWIKDLITPVTGLVRGLVTTDKDRLDAVERMAEIDVKFGEKELDYKMQVARSGNVFSKSVRPVIAYFFLFMYGLNKSKQDWVFSERDYELFLYVVLFYFGLRSSEKLIGVIKGK